MRSISLLCLFAIVFFAFSCTTQKPVANNYLQNVKDTSGKNAVNIQQPVVQKGDLLSIKIFSKANGLNPQADAPYNLQEASTAVSGGSGTSTSGFMVDQNGNIEYPQLGSLHVEGLTREQVADLIKSRVDSLLTNPSVIVRFQNFKISVLGEVNHPGSFTLPTERVTILEALGLSGDITEFGTKNNVMVIREDNNGQVERGMIDLTSEAMFSSPYYRLQQNDVVLVESNGKKVKQQQRQETAQQIGIATSVITAIALILNFIK